MPQQAESEAKGLTGMVRSEPPSEGVQSSADGVLGTMKMRKRQRVSSQTHNVLKGEGEQMLKKNLFSSFLCINDK